MKRLLLILPILLLALGAFAANPPYEAFLGTNGIVIRSNPPIGKILVDGAFITNGGSPVFVTTNLFVVNNTYTSNLFTTNIFVNQTLVTSNIFATNITVNNLFVTNVFATNINVQNITVNQTLFVISNIFVSNIYATNITVNNLNVTSNLFVTNLFSTNIFVENISVTSNLFVNNTYATNIFVEQNIFTTNLYATNIFVDQDIITSNFFTINNFSSNITVTNIFVNQTVVTSNLFVTNLVANTIIGKDILWTNDNGTVRLIDQTRVGIGTNSSDAMWLLEAGTNVINAFAYSTGGVQRFVINSNGEPSILKGITYSWPSSQGAAGTVLTNNGSGVLGWGTVSGSGGGVGFGDLVWTNTGTNLITRNLSLPIALFVDGRGSEDAALYARKEITNTTREAYYFETRASDNGNFGVTLYPFRHDLKVGAAGYYAQGAGTYGGYFVNALPNNDGSGFWGGVSCTVGVVGYGQMISGTNAYEIGVLGEAVSGNTNYGVSYKVGVSGYGKMYDGETNSHLIGLSGTAVGNPNAPNVTINGGILQTILDTIEGDPVPTNAVLLLDNRISGVPLLVGRTNNNTVVFSVDGVGDLTKLKSVPYSWPSAQGAAQTVLTNNGSGVLGWGTVAASGGSGTNFDSIRVTNQVLYVPQEFNGSNGTSAVILTNNLDVHLNTWKKMTNVLGTNLVFHLSNLVESTSFIQTFYGNGGTTNTVSYRIPGGGTGTNIWWYGETNGSYDFQVSPGHSVTVNGFVDSQTNIVMAWSTTANLPKLNFFAINGWISNLFATNITFINGSVSNLIATNIFVKVGGGASNAAVGGTYAVNSTPIMTAGTAETNLLTHSIAAHSLTNLHDRLLIRASGRFVGNVNTKQLKLVYGTTTILDTTAQIANGGGWVITAEIIRTGNATQTASAEYHGTAESLFTTASAISMAEDNGIANTIKITGTTATASGDVTNRTLVVEYRRAPGP